MLVCGDTDDSGVVLEQQFYVLREAGIDGVPAPRLAISSEYHYNSAGTPIVTRTEVDYNELGDVVEVRDLGRTAVNGDELTTTTAYATLNVASYLGGFACHDQVIDAAGEILRESWRGYDGATAVSCAAVTTGDLTELRRGVSGRDDVSESFAYNQEGMVHSHTNPRGHVKTSLYDPLHPWLKISESTLIAAYDGAKILTRLWTYYGAGIAPNQNFGLPYQQVGYDGSVTEHRYDSFGRPVATVMPEDDPATPSRVTSYSDWDGDGQPLRPARVDQLSLIAIGQYAAKTSFLDGWGRVARAESTPPTNDGGCDPLRGCYVVSEEKRYDEDGRVVQTLLPYFDIPTLTERPAVRTKYDLLGRITEVQGANGAVTTHAYDREFATTEDADGVVTVVESDARGRVRYQRAYVDSSGTSTWYATTETEHDALGRVRRMVDAHGNEWSFEYDRLGRKIRSATPTPARSSSPMTPTTTSWSRPTPAMPSRGWRPACSTTRSTG